MNNPANRGVRYLWVVIPLISSVVLAQAIIPQGLPVLYPFIQSEFGLSRAQVGLLTSAYGIGFGATVFFSGWLTDVFGVKRLAVISLVSLVVLTQVFMFARSFPVLLALMVFIAIMISPLHPATTRAVLDWVPGRIRALAMSLKQDGFPIAGALAAVVLPALAVLAGWRTAAAVTGGLVLIIAVAFILLYHDVPQNRGTAPKLHWTTLHTLLRNRALMVTMLWGNTFSGFQYTILTYFMLFLIEEMGFSAVMAGGMLAIVQVTSIIARTIWGAASDFLFKGRRNAVLAIIGFITVAWMTVISLTGAVNASSVYIIAIAVGVSAMSYHGVIITLVGEQAEAGQIGVTVGLASALTHLSQMLMPPLFGWLVDVTNSYSLGWRALAVLALAATVMLLVLGREPARR